MRMFSDAYWKDFVTLPPKNNITYNQKVQKQQIKKIPPLTNKIFYVIYCNVLYVDGKVCVFVYLRFLPT